MLLVASGGWRSCCGRLLFEHQECEAELLLLNNDSVVFGPFDEDALAQMGPSSRPSSAAVACSCRPAMMPHLEFLGVLGRSMFDEVVQFAPVRTVQVFSDMVSCL